MLMKILKQLNDIYRNDVIKTFIQKSYAKILGLYLISGK